MAASVGAVQVEPGEEVKFEAIAQDDWGQDLTADTKWTWDFGDGEQSNQNPIWHVFKGAGTFEVTMSGCCVGEQASDFYTEVWRDMADEWGWTEAEKVHVGKVAALHELGHHFGLKHHYTKNPDSVMWVAAYNEDEDEAPQVPLEFKDADLDEIRRTFWP